MFLRACSPVPVSETPSRSHAIVIGGSIAGLLAAHVLARRFDRVTLLERDRLPEEAIQRAGAPQGRHAHALMAGGLQALETLIPGIGARLHEAGAVRTDAGREFQVHYRSGRGAAFASDIVQYNATRPLIETVIRQAVLANPRIQSLTEIEVTGLLLDSHHQAVQGVRLRERGQEEIGKCLQGDLVVDASGRNSQAAVWLEAFGFPKAEETVLDADWGYASRLYAMPEGWKADWRLLYALSRPGTLSRGGGVQPVEGGRWLITLIGVVGDYPPTDERGFQEFADSLSTPEIARALRAATPLGPIHGYRRTANRMRHYERLTHRPEGFLLQGDSVCALNPVYGQGITASALSALTLEECLRTHPSLQDLTGLATRFQKRLARTLAGPWTIATSEDLRWLAIGGRKRSLPTRLLHAYLDRVIALLPHDPAIAHRYIEVMQMLRPPQALLHPSVLLAVLKHSLKGRASRTSTVPISVPDYSTSLVD